MRGKVKWFNAAKGYGFITSQSTVSAAAPDIFVHISAVEHAGLAELKEGQIVDYEIVEDRSRKRAENLRIVAQPKG